MFPNKKPALPITKGAPMEEMDDDNAMIATKPTSTGKQVASPAPKASGKQPPNKFDPDGDGDDDSKEPDEAKEAAYQRSGKGKVDKHNKGSRGNRKVADPHGLGEFIDRIKGTPPKKGKM